MSYHYLGVDIGGTKSHALITNKEGEILGIGIGGPGKHRGTDYRITKKTIKNIVTQALEQSLLGPSDITGAGFGISGYDWPSDHEPHLKAISVLSLSCPFELVNDTFLGIIAGTTEGWGISVVSGTSCNCRGLTADGRTGRTVGFGLKVGEGAGGEEIVEKAFHKISSAWRKDRPHTSLSDCFIDAVGASDADDLIEGVLRGYYHIGASIAPLVFRESQRGDKAAEEVIEWAGNMLGKQILSVSNQLDFNGMPIKIVLIGGVFQIDSQIIKYIEKKICPNLPEAKLIKLKPPPVIGAVLMAMETAGCEKSTISSARHTLQKRANLEMGDGYEIR